MNFAMVISVVVVLTTGSQVYSETCRKQSSCACLFNNGSLVDLSPLAQNNSQPRFDDVTDNKTEFYYSWNPCLPFTEDLSLYKARECMNVSVCQNSYIGLTLYSCGTQESSTFGSDADTGVLTLNYHDEKNSRKSTVKLICSSTESFTFDGEVLTEGPHYMFTLKSVAACPGTAPITPTTVINTTTVTTPTIVTTPASPTTPTTVTTPASPTTPVPPNLLSTGSILLIIFFVVLVAYFIAGVLLNKFYNNHTGSNLVPNHGFWTGLPSLIKDGAVFVVSPCVTKTSYANIA